jgi:polyhydroxyalkanoate synthesis regulator phasin
MAAFEQLSGMAGEIRAATTSEQFDLAGYTEARAKELMVQAFSTPLDAPTEMVKFTFVVGGGKLVRSRYSDDMTKWVTNALKELGYSDDRSAAVDFTSQGTYKQQHDTGQNLKYLIVFPRVTCGQDGGGGGKASSSDTGTAGPNTSSKEYIVAACEFSTFCEIVNSKTQSWSQRKRLLKVLQDAKVEFDALEQKLMQGALLSPAEQAVYDSNSGCDTEKIAWLQGEIKGMVDSGKLTAEEKTQLVESMGETLKGLEEELAQEQAGAASAPKLEKLGAKATALRARLQTVQSAAPVTHRLRKGDEIQKCVVELQPLYALEERGRAVALTIADLRTLEGKSDLEDRMAGLEVASR